MITKKDVALKILKVGKAGFTTQEDGLKKLAECEKLVEDYGNEQLILSGVSKCLHQDMFPVNRHGDSQCADCGKIMSHLDL